MSLYVIGDLHLSLSGEKPMDVFGPLWENHVERLREAFSHLNGDDVTVLAGDTSWGMSLEESLPDFAFWTRCRAGSCCSRETTIIGGRRRGR